jgi:hypothetical protein
MMEMFDRGIQLRMGQCHVHRWTQELLPAVCADGDLWAWRTSPPTARPWSRHPRRTTCSIKSTTAASRSCSTHERHVRQRMWRTDLAGALRRPYVSWSRARSGD